MNDAVATIGIGGIIFFYLLMIVVLILWIILPFFVFKIRNTVVENRASVENMEAAINEMAGRIDKLAEIAENEHNLKMVAMKAKRSQQKADT